MISPGVASRSATPRWRHLLASLLPAYLRSDGLKRSAKPSPTAYLDGLRGWAAFLVIFYHSGKADYMRWMQRLPIIHFLDAGHSMVAIFFVISGYVLSQRLLQHIRAQRADAFMTTLASSAFRRWIRLYLPTGLASLICAIMIHTHVFNGAPVSPASNVFGEIGHWFIDFLHAGNPFVEIRGWWYPQAFRTAYLDQMWTIPVEFRGSMILFGFIAAVSKLSTRGRRIITWFTIIACYCWQAVYISMFLQGMYIADIALDWRAMNSASTGGVEGQPLHPAHHDEEAHQRADGVRQRLVPVSHKLGYWCLLVLSIYLLGQPDKLESDYRTYGWQYLYKLIPSWWVEAGYEQLWLGIGSFTLVWVLEAYPPFQWPLNWAFSQYLGEMCFGLYALHLPLFWSLELTIWRPWIEREFPGIPPPMWITVLTLLFDYLIILWAADYFTRADKYIIRFGRWVQGVLFVEWNGTSAEK